MDNSQVQYDDETDVLYVRLLPGGRVALTHSLDDMRPSMYVVILVASEPR